MLTCCPKKEKPVGSLWLTVVSWMLTVPATGVVTVVLTGSEELALPSPVEVETVPPAATDSLALSTAVWGGVRRKAWFCQLIRPSPTIWPALLMPHASVR